jgi:flagellin
MALNIISNFAANVAHRNLVASDKAATESLAKLSAGTRVVSAKDDAASMAIGSRLNAEVNALRQALVNAGQAVSMVQIADGAMAKIDDILVRMKALSVQAGSGQLSSTERSMLNTEYQQLLSEVNRIATDTEFNGNQLVNGSLTNGGNATGSTGSFAVADGVSSITGRGYNTSNTGTLTYATVSGGGGNFTFSFNSVNYTGSIASTVLNASNGLTTGTSVELTNSSNPEKLVIGLNTAFDSATNVTSSTNQSLSFTGSSTTSFSFKVGTGTNSSADAIAVSIDSVSASNLAISGTAITTVTNADAASSLISSAITTLNTARANVGATQNRLEFASVNISSAIENTEAARSNLLDLDVASEMAQFTSKQILLQAGVAMLAQANQIPQNLLRLLQQ